MSYNTQNPYFYTLDGNNPDVIEIDGATSISVFADGGACQISNLITSQFINIPDGTTLELNADSGCTLALMNIVPSAGFAYVVMLGGVGQITS